ncbi:MAG: OmpA family protein, partial [Litorimonas sp.]
MKTQFIMLSAMGALTLSACATKADPLPTQEAAPVIQAPAQVERAPVFEQIEQAPPQTIAPQENLNLPIPGSAEDFAYRTGGEPRVYFGYDKYALSTEARNSLRSQADWLNQYANYTAVVEGHADERGTREYNLALAARRA